MSVLVPLRRTALGFALGAFVVGGARAAWSIAPRTWVLDFAAGEPSPWSEKLDAIAQSAAIEGLGFLAVGLFLGLAAALLARLLPGLRASPVGFGAALVLVSGALFGWVDLAWIATDALDFLTRGQVLALDALAFVAFVVVLVVYERLIRLCPWTRGSRLVTAAASLAGAAAGAWIGLRVVRGAEGGWRSPATLALAAAAALASVPAAALLAAALARPLTALGERLARGPLAPRALTLALAAALGLTSAWTLARGALSPIESEPQYAALPAREGPPGPNVVLITVDTLRADHLSCYGYERPTSPFLDSLAAAGARCADASAPASWTKPSTGTILTGLYPSRHGALYHGSSLHVPEGERTLAEAFAQRGYVTAGFVANPNVKAVFDFDRGFDEYFDAPVQDTLTLASLRTSSFGRMLMALLRHKFNWNYENDISSMNREVLAWLRQNHSSRFFLYVHYIDPHDPYDPPAAYREQFARGAGTALFNERKRKVGIDLYDGEIRYTDDGLKALVEALREHGAWENTLFVLTSDHGEEFFEHGVLGHGFSLYQEVVHVPLILHGPGVPAGVVLEEPVAVLDMPATLLDLAGAGVERFGDGRSFAARLRGAAPAPSEALFLESEFGQTDADHREFVFSGLRMGPWKLVLTERNKFFPPSVARFGREALFHLGDDPGESRNLFHVAEHEQRVAEWIELLRAHAQFLAETGFRDIPPAALTPEIEAGLRALGYIGGE
jgi:arylsulfatase A-like enzyme